jgi:hypothetical protein
VKVLPNNVGDHQQACRTVVFPESVNGKTIQKYHGKCCRKHECQPEQYEKYKIIRSVRKRSSKIRKTLVIIFNLLLSYTYLAATPCSTYA